MTSISKQGPISTTIRKKNKNGVTAPGIKYYDPIYRIGENIPARIGGDDRLDNLFEGDTLLVNKEDEPTGHINMTYHVLSVDAKDWSVLKNYSYFGALQKSQPKLNAILQKNPGQNKETIPVQKTSFVLTDVHELDVDERYEIGQKLYATPEKAPEAYNTLASVPGAFPDVWRFTVAKEGTFLNALGLVKGTADARSAMKKFCVGRAHNGKKEKHGNVYYTIGF